MTHIISKNDWIRRERTATEHRLKFTDEELRTLPLDSMQLNRILPRFKLKKFELDIRTERSVKAYEEPCFEPLQREMLKVMQGSEFLGFMMQVEWHDLSLTLSVQDER